MNYKQTNVMLVGRSATISGWGYTEWTTKLPYLMEATNKIVKTDVEIKDHVVSKTRILQMTQDGGRGSCSGDSGGIWLRTFSMLLQNGKNGYRKIISMQLKLSQYL